MGAEPQALEDGLQTWIAHTENAWYAERGLGQGRVFRLQFNRIADDPDRLFRELCEFLGEPYAPECLLPLQKKVNSSRVDSRRESNLELLRDNPVFQRAQAVFAMVSAQPATGHADETSLGILAQRLQDYCRDRSIV